jgi:hypothetical protein
MIAAKTPYGKALRPAPVALRPAPVACALRPLPCALRPLPCACAVALRPLFPSPPILDQPYRAVAIPGCLEFSGYRWGGIG